MKRLTKNIVLTIAIGIAGSASTTAATMLEEICPYIGAEYKYMGVKAKGAFWENNLPQHYRGGTIYVGTRFMENLGVELGWSHAFTKKYSFTFTTASSTITNESKFNSFHLDLMGFWALHPCWELFGAVGVAAMTGYSNFDGVSIGPMGFATAAANSRYYVSATKAVARVGAGVQYLFTDMFGARASVRWENTSSLKVRGNSNVDAAVTNGFLGAKPYKDAISLALGLFVYF